MPVLVLAGLALGRLTRTTATWPLVALLAAQPLPFLLLTGEQLTGPAGVAVALAVAAADVVAARALRRGLAPVARVLAGVATVVGAVGGLAVAGGSDTSDSWTATGVLAVAGAGALVVERRGGPIRFNGWSRPSSARSSGWPWPVRWARWAIRDRGSRSAWA